jgi:hypothetical protein
MSAEGIKAGRAYVEIDADARKAQRELKDFQASVQASGREMQKIGAAAAGVGIGIVASLTAAAISAAAYGDALNDLSAKTGIAVASLASLGYAAEQSGTSLDGLEIAVKKMQNAVADAANGNAAAKASFDRLGISIDTLQGKSPDEQFRLLASRIGAIADPAQRTAAAVDVFGKSGTDILPILAGGADGLAKMEQRARDLGIVMGAEAAASVGELDDAISELGSQFGALKNIVGATIAEAIIPYRDTVATAFAGVIQFAKENKTLIVTVAGLGVALVTLGGAVFAVGAYTIVAAKGITALTAGMVALRAAMAAHPILLVAGVLTAVGVAAYYAINATDQYTQSIEDNAVKTMRANDAQRSLSRSQSERLAELAEAQRLSNEQADEAESIIAKLTAKHGDLGIAIDQNTGRITGMADAQARLNDEQLRGELLDAKKVEQETTGNIRVLEQQVVRDRTGTVDINASAEATKKIDEQLRLRQDAQDRIAAARASRFLIDQTRDRGGNAEQINAARQLGENAQQRIALQRRIDFNERTNDDPEKLAILREQLAAAEADAERLGKVMDGITDAKPNRNYTVEAIAEQTKALEKISKLQDSIEKDRMSALERELEAIRDTRDERIAAAQAIIDAEGKAGRPNSEAATAARAIVGGQADEVANTQIADRVRADIARQAQEKTDAAQAVADLEMQQEIEIAKLRKDNRRADALEVERYLREQEKRFVELGLQGDELAKARQRAQEIAGGLLTANEPDQDINRPAKVFADARAAAVAGGLGGSVNVLENEAKKQTKQSAEQTALLKEIARKVGIPSFN